MQERAVVLAQQLHRYRGAILTYVVLILLASGMVIPLVWTILTSFKFNVDVTLGWIAPRWTLDNYSGVVQSFAFFRYYANSLVIATTVTMVQVVTSVLAAYAFSRLQFRGRDVIFLGYLATMMIPSDVLIIPQFVLMKKIPEWLNLVFNTEFFSGFLYFGAHYVGHPVGLNSFFALIVPGCFSAYGTFMLRQFLLGISREIEEAAYIDGCSTWGVFWHVVVPLSKPALGALAIFTFLGRWRAFLWPLIMTDSDSMMVLPVGLAKLSDLYTNDYGLICAGSVLMLVPMIIVFVFCQRWFISGIQLGAVKG
jgi:multiple sugar transport system permease protein